MMQPDGGVATVEVAADGDGLVSREGTALIAAWAGSLGAAGRVRSGARWHARPATVRVACWPSWR
jgi:hypothetical protein